MTDLDAFFHDYADSYNQALGEAPDYARIRGYFTDECLAAGPQGVKTYPNDDGFAKLLEQGYSFYKAIGTQRMNLVRVKTTPIDGDHVMAKVFYRADYRRKDSSRLSIDFDVTYLLWATDPPKIFAFVAGDEMSLYRAAGLVDEDGKPL